MATGSSSPPTSDSPELTLSGEKVYVAVGREAAECRATLLWALHKFHQGAASSFVLLHVYSPPKFLPVLGARIPAAQVEEHELIAYKEKELQRVSDSLDQYLLLCAQEKVQAEKLVVESDDVAQGLVELISEHHVTVLVMGAAADKKYTKKMKILKSKKARVVEREADPFCKIWFICKGTLVYPRKAVPLSHEEMQEGSQSSRLTLSSAERSASLSEMWCVANTWLHKSIIEPQIERTTSDLSDNRGEENVKATNESYDNFQHILRELESVRREAYEEKCRREEAERELFAASQRAQAFENSYFRELKQKNELIEKLMTTMEEVESLIKRTDELCAKLQEEREQRMAMEKRGAHSDRIIKDLMLQRDKALREAETLRTTKREYTATAEGTMHITELSYSEITEATNNFDRSLKIGESAYGGVYKGFLRHTNVAIKKLNPESTQSQSQFNQEVEILSRVRHPNLVTLMGTCKDAQALVYEFMPNGNLDDRLACKDNSKPLSWQSGFGLLKDVQRAVEKGCLQAILDPSAREWPAIYAEQLAQVGLRCCEIRRKNRPDLQTEVWTVLEPMLKSASVTLCSLSFKSVSEDLGGVPSYFICPILQDVMRDPLIAADGFTYEAEAIREWLDSGHRTSPMTNLELPHRDLLPNHALRSAIQEWLQTNAE
ncbi:U-box domain-containing protein 33-like isoform X5 [Phragmites australis]|uniref:U-box domain-containing protein 33-like isoform X5 n=1 Tax=Phragmites australis TaxID=29695 RepID=UPI002D77A156|nr:U-box domain-containing protein 33-like isoform X5 [Phragmites australis]